jgi:hypothetical protein
LDVARVGAEERVSVVRDAIDGGERRSRRRCAKGPPDRRARPYAVTFNREMGCRVRYGPNVQWRAQ